MAIDHLVVSTASAAFSIGVGTIGCAIGIGAIGGAGLKAAHYQPAVSGSILKTMLVAMAVTESSAIFCLVISIVLLFTPITMPGWEKLWALAGAGLCVGIGNLGSGIGKGLIGAEAVEGIARNPQSEGPVTRLMLLTQAITESPAIFALVVSLSLIFIDLPKHGFAFAASLVSAGLCMGIGTMGPAYGEGYAASIACRAVSLKPSSFAIVLRTLLVGMALIESCGVYAMVSALCILYLT